MPEIHPDVAHAAGAAVVATGRSDFPNQINNVLAFPGIFRGALDVGATRITEGMKLAAADAIAGLVGDDLAADHIVPDPFDPRLAATVAHGGRCAAVADGVVRRAVPDAASMAPPSRGARRPASLAAQPDGVVRARPALGVTSAPVHRSRRTPGSSMHLERGTAGIAHGSARRVERRASRAVDEARDGRT